MLEYELIRSRRRTLALQVRPDGSLVIRAPLRAPDDLIRRFAAEHTLWAETHRQAALERCAAHPEPDEARRAELIARAKAELPDKVRLYAERMGLQPAGITVTGARTRFGSCSAKGRLSFSWRLMQYPEAAVDYVVVHELAHLLRRDHSPAFYAVVASVLPDYKERVRMLRE